MSAVVRVRVRFYDTTSLARATYRMARREFGVLREDASLMLIATIARCSDPTAPRRVRLHPPARMQVLVR